MKFFRFFCLDVREGFTALWRWYALAVVFFFLCIASLHLQAGFYRFGAIDFTFGDYLVTFVSGMKPFDPNLGEPFHFPIAWAVLFLLVSYITLWYPYRDLMGAGKQMVVAGGSRWAWWLAKCAWVVVAVSLFFLIALLAAAAWIFVSKGEFSLHISPELPELLDLRLAQGCSPSYEVLSCLLLVPGATAALCLVQLLLSLLFRPPLSYTATLALLFLSAFYSNPWLIGNYLMVGRSASMMLGGMQVREGAILAASLAVITVAVGGLIFSRMDILNKEELS